MLRPASRDHVYEVIDGERDYQDSLGPDRTELTSYTVSDSLILMDSYMRKAKDAWTNNPGDLQALHEIRKIAAIAVRCMEGQGSPVRVNPIGRN